MLIASLDDTAAYTSRSSKAFRTRLDETTEDPSTVVMNLNTGATTRYTNFYMTSMCKIGDKYYGVDDTGLHVLEGGKDNLLSIPCEIGFGRYGLKSMSSSTYQMSILVEYFLIASSLSFARQPMNTFILQEGTAMR